MALTQTEKNELVVPAINLLCQALYAGTVPPETLTPLYEALRANSKSRRREARYTVRPGSTMTLARLTGHGAYLNGQKVIVQRVMRSRAAVTVVDTGANWRVPITCLD